jgi:multidrug resistance efflux pump
VVVVITMFVRGRIIAAKKPPERKPQGTAVSVVDAIPITPARISPAVSAFGTVEPLVSLPVQPEVAGRVIEVTRPLRPGTTFAKGDVLWKVEQRDYELAVERTEAELVRLGATARRLNENKRVLGKRRGIAKELLALAEGDVTRYKQLAGKGAASPEVLDRSRASLEQRHDAVAGLEGSLANIPHELAELQASIKDAEARLELAKLALSRTVVTAPFAGRVVTGMVDIGTVLGPGKPAVTIEDTSAVEVHAQFTMKQLSWATFDDGAVTATVRLRNEGGEARAWKAVLSRTAGSVDPRTQSQTLVFRVDDPQPPGTLPGLSALVPGLFVAVDLPGTEVDRAVAAPRRAVRDDGRVVVVVEEKLAFRDVQIVRDQGDDVLLTGDLQDGDLLVVNPPRDAVEGTAVRVRAQRPSVARLEAAP